MYVSSRSIIVQSESSDSSEGAREGAMLGSLFLLKMRLRNECVEVGESGVVRVEIDATVGVLGVGMLALSRKWFRTDG